MNLLPQGNFEAPWDGSHQVTVYPATGAPFTRDKAEIHRPTGWDVWYRHEPNNDPAYHEPECTYVHRHLTPERIHAGNNAYRLFCSFRPFWAGLRAQVHVTRGHNYKLTAFAHAWSNHNGHDAIPGREDCIGDPACSWGAGRGPYATLFDDLPPLNGDPWNDALHAAAFAIGIDPTGGLDPDAPTVCWSPHAAIYNSYAPLTITTCAVSSTITVFLESIHRWAFRNNDAYWDSVSLVAVDAPADPVRYTPPAFDYVKTTVLLPPLASPELRAATAIACSHPDLQSTDCQSVEDAASGPPDRTVKAVGWGTLQDNLRRYVDDHYPGTKLTFIEGSTPTEIALQLLPPLATDVALAQTDPRWATAPFGEDPHASLAAYGCFVTACAIILRDVYNVDLTPPLLDQLLVNARHAFVSGNLLHWAGFCGLFGRLQDPVKHNRILPAAELRQLLDDHAIILRRHDGGHFVVLEAVRGDVLHVIDTYDGQRKTWSLHDYAGIRAVRVTHRGLPPPDPDPPAPNPPAGAQGPVILFGAQEQRYGIGRDEFISRVQPPAWMLIQGYEQAQRIKELSPDTLVIIRHVDDAWGQYLYADDVDAAARRFVDRFRGALEANAQWIDYVVGLNEYIACNDYKALRASGPWVEAFCAELERIGYPGRPIAFNAGVGNPQHNWICDAQGIERQIPLLVRGARALMHARGAFGHHAYHGSRRDGFCTLTTKDADGRPNRIHFSMRSLLSIDPVFLQHGVVVDHVLTELGAIYFDHQHGMLNAMAGWRWPATMGDAAADRYVDELLILNRYLRDWNAVNDGRLKAALLFLYGGHDGWRYFDLEGGFSAKLADALVAIKEATRGTS